MQSSASILDNIVNPLANSLEGSEFIIAWESDVADNHLLIKIIF